MKQKFDVTGMSCSACSAHVEKAVSRVPGVDQVQVNLLQNSMVVEYEDEATDAAAIIHAVEDAGYGASVKDAHEPAKKAENDLRQCGILTDPVCFHLKITGPVNGCAGYPISDLLFYRNALTSDR